MKRTILFIILALSFSLSCTPEEQQGEADRTGLRITHTELSFSYEKTRYPVTIMTDSPWTIVSDVSWLKATIEGAAYGMSFFVEAEANDEDTVRKGVLTVSNSMGSRTITVLQEPDRRNFTDIFLTAEPSGYERVEGSRLVIPYREGNNMQLEEISVSVAGVSKGTVTVESLYDVRLQEGEGEISLAVSGRVGPAGKLLFTVSGLPPTVFGDAAQCMVEVSGETGMKEFMISELYELPEGELVQPGIIRGTVVSDAGAGNIDECVVAFQDDEAGLMVRIPDGVELTAYDKCEMFIRGGILSRENGVLYLSIEYADDIDILSVGNVVEPMKITEMFSESYMSMLCCIDLTQVSQDDLQKQSYAGMTLMERYGWEDKFYMYVSEQADFAGTKPSPASGSIVGIIGVDAGGNMIIMPRNAEDLAGMTGGRLLMDAVWEVDHDVLSDVSASGSEDMCFCMTSSVPWSLVSDDGGWIYDWSITSSQGSDSPVRVSFKVRPNTGARRTAVITVSGSGVPAKFIRIVQLEGTRILDEDFSGVRDALAESPKYFPSSAGTDYAKALGQIGLEGWYSTNCYGALSPDGEYGLLRIGKTYTKGYIQTPYFAAIGDTPVNIRVDFLSGILKGCIADWVGLELDGPGRIVPGGDVTEITKYDDTYTASLMETLPMFVVHSLSSTELKRVSVVIEGANQDTMLRLTATCKGGSATAACNMFFVGDLHVEYID